MSLKGINESLLLWYSWLRCSWSFRDQLSPIPTTTVQKPMVWSDLGYFWMTEINTVDTGIFTAEMFAIHFACDLIESQPQPLRDLNRLECPIKRMTCCFVPGIKNKRTRKSLRYLVELGYDIALIWILSHVGYWTDHCKHVWYSHKRKEKTADRMARKMEWILLVFNSTGGFDHGWLRR
jgi:hypothetical protein